MTQNEHALLFPLASSAMYVTSVVPLKKCGRLTARRETIICGAKLLLSSAMGVLQFAKAFEFSFKLTLISKGHPIKTDGVTSVSVNQCNDDWKPFLRFPPAICQRIHVLFAHKGFRHTKNK